MHSNEIKFDELDVKFFEDFPLIVDVFTSTINKISHFLQQFHEELLILVSEEITKQKGWNINHKEAYNVRHVPFKGIGKRTFSIEHDLISRYEVFSLIQVAKIEEKTLLNYFNLLIGFYFEPKEGNKQYIYFSIAKYDIEEKVGGVINTLSFYETLQNEKFDIEILHPEKGNEIEDFFIRFYELNAVNIEEGFDYYKECLTKYFANIKW